MAQKFTTLRSPGGHLLTIDKNDGLADGAAYLEDIARHDGSHGYVVVSEGGALPTPLFSKKHQALSLYVGILLRPSFPAEKGGMLPVIAALSLVHTIRRHSILEPAIRWVSDVYAAKVKVAGVTTRAALAQDGTFRYVTVNLSLLITSSFAGDLHEVVKSVFSSKKETEEERIAGTLITEFFTLYEAFATKENTQFLDEYRALSLLRGKRIRYFRDGKRHRGTVIGIDDRARLVVTPRHGKRRSVVLHSVAELYDKHRPYRFPPAT